MGLSYGVVVAIVGLYQSCFVSSLSVSVTSSVNVVLYGLEGNGGLDECQLAVDTEHLERMLQTVLPSRRPYFIDTGTPSAVEYQISYKVIAAKKPDVDIITSALSSALVPVSVQPLGFITHVIDVSTITHIFSRQAVQYADGVRDRLTVLVINPDKRLMRGLPTDRVNQPFSNIANVCNAGFNYTYRSGNDFGLSCSWVGSGSYVVIDLRAGPCNYGPITGKGVVSAGTLPSLTGLLSKPRFAEMCKTDRGCTEKLQLQIIKPLMLGLLCSSITSAIEHVLIPDILFEEPTFAKRVLVPILILRERQSSRYSSLDKFGIDLSIIKREMRKLLPGGQEMVTTFGIHNLHDHPLISVALRKALKDIVASSVCFQKNCSWGRRYLSSHDLLTELQHSHDVLAEGLMTERRDFLMPQYPEDITQTFDSFLGESVASSVRDKLEMHWKKMATQGARIVPVYVFDMSSLGSGILFDQQSSVSWSSTSVLVLHSPDRESSTNLPYFTTCGVMADSNGVTQHIVAGLAGALGSIVPPHLRFSHIHNETEVDYLWATGVHPFSPFTGSHELSRHFSLIALRNAIVSQIQSVFITLMDIEKAIYDFSQEHLHPIHDDEGDHHLDTSNEIQIRVATLTDKMLQLRKKVQSFLDAVKLSRLSKALDDIPLLVRESSHLQVQCHHELSEARTRMACCHKVYYASRVSWTEMMGIPLALAAVVLLMIWFVSACIS